MVVLEFLIVRSFYSRKLKAVYVTLESTLKENKRLDDLLHKVDKPLSSIAAPPETKKELGQIAAIITALAALIAASGAVLNNVWTNYSTTKVSEANEAKTRLQSLVLFPYERWQNAKVSVQNGPAGKPIVISLDNLVLSEWNLKNVTLRYRGTEPAIIESHLPITVKFDVPQATGLRLLVRPIKAK